MHATQLRYLFKPAESCNMCGSPRNRHRLLGKRLNGSQGIFPGRKRGITTTVMRCEVCGLVFADPMPIPFDPQDHYGIPPEEYWKQEYFEASDAYFSDVIDRFKALADFRPGMSALDIGAGLGKAMAAMERAGFETHGFEPSKPFRDRALDRMGMDPARLRHGDMETITYSPGSFDFITFGAVLEHLYDPAGSIGKAMAWLKPGGLIHAEVPSSSWLIGRIANLVYRLQGTDYVGNISPMHPPFHIYEFALPCFRENGRRLGYNVAHHEYYVCETFLPKVLDPFLRWYMKRTDTGMQLSVWLTKEEAQKPGRQ